MKFRAGFTLIELIIFVAIFSVAMSAFLGVFINVVGVAARQSSTAEVQSQSQFLLQTIQHYVERSSMVSMTVDTATPTLVLRMSSSTEDPVVLGLFGTAVKLTTKSGTAQAVTSTITSGKVEVSDLLFTRRSNPGGKDSVAVSFTVAYTTGNSTQRFTTALQTAVARVSAATFDSNIVPDVGGTYELGTSAGHWRSINNTLFFNGANVGIGESAPAKPLQVAGGDVYVSDSAAGIIFKNGTSCYRLYLTAGGGIATTSVSCP